MSCTLTLLLDYGKKMKCSHFYSATETLKMAYKDRNNRVGHYNQLQFQSAESDTFDSAQLNITTSKQERTLYTCSVEFSKTHKKLSQRQQHYRCAQSTVSGDSMHQHNLIPEICCLVNKQLLDWRFQRFPLAQRVMHEETRSKTREGRDNHNSTETRQHTCDRSTSCSLLYFESTGHRTAQDSTS